MNQPNNFARLRPVKPEILRGQARTANEHLTVEQVAVVVRSLQKTMHACDGLGLAAPQLGIPVRIAVLEDDLVSAVFVDPKTEYFGKKEDRTGAEEGCLSLPGRRFLVKRAPAVKVTSHLDPRYPVTYIFRGFLARIAQHELDHLEGLLIDATGEEVITQKEAS